MTYFRASEDGVCISRWWKLNGRRSGLVCSRGMWTCGSLGGAEVEDDSPGGVVVGLLGLVEI